MSHGYQRQKRIKHNFHPGLDLSEVIGKRAQSPNIQDDQSSILLDPTVPPARPPSQTLFNVEPSPTVPDIALSNSIPSFIVANTPTSIGLSNQVSSLSSSIRNTATEFYEEAKKAEHSLKIQQMVKFQLFRHYKFFDREMDMMFNSSEDSICGFMLKNMHIVTEPELWWIANKKQIRKDHTMHRNNTIKNIHFKFKGMCPITLFTLCDHFALIF
jgi:hypothetical protein